MDFSKISSGVNIWEIPAAEPPPGVVPNLVNPQWDGWVAIPIATVFLMIMYVVVGLKIYYCVALSGGFELGDCKNTYALFYAYQQFLQSLQTGLLLQPSGPRICIYV